MSVEDRGYRHCYTPLHIIITHFKVTPSFWVFISTLFVCSLDMLARWGALSNLEKDNTLPQYLGSTATLQPRQNVRLGRVPLFVRPLHRQTQVVLPLRKERSEPPLLRGQGSPQLVEAGHPVRDMLSRMELPWRVPFRVCPCTDFGLEGSPLRFCCWRRIPQPAPWSSGIRESQVTLLGGLGQGSYCRCGRS